eukprot:Phypoly_transcript_01546.p1 GENE.Phypoly_transcript_01546~~Phypoly_transcript_01546.p1  ORF type:complete len:662 (-),score=147.61 Phypoly_transcript_01546:310-2295(-)
MANRKLQGEIDKILKKVAEGVVEFDGILKKVYAATSSNQKEKYEGDLKKEIKKLQRYRDQIKVWITSNEVKQKTALVDCRKLIETKMEQFKACEKETKTKAYSKEGLGLQKHDNDALNQARGWVVKGIDSLKAQIDQFESELENIPARKKKQESTRVEQLNTQIERHKFHLNALEQILRYLDNERLSTDKVMDIKDSVEYYIESNQEPYFQEEEDIYDSLGVKIRPVTDDKQDDDDDDMYSNGLGSGSGGEDEDLSDNDHGDDVDDIATDDKDDNEDTSTPTPPPPAQPSNKASSKKTDDKKDDKALPAKDDKQKQAQPHVTTTAHPTTQLPQPQTLPLPLPLPTPTTTPPPNIAKDDKMQRGTRRTDAGSAKQGPPPGLALPPQSQLSPQRTTSRMPGHTPDRKPEEARGRGVPTHPQPHPHMQSIPIYPQQQPQQQTPHTTSLPQQQLPQSALPLAPPPNILSQPPPASLQAKHSFLQQQFTQLNIASKDEAEGKEKQHILAHGDTPQGPATFNPSSLTELSSSALRSSDLSDLDELSEPLVVRRAGSTEVFPPSQGGSASGPAAMLAASFANIPESIDTERPSTYLPKNPAIMSSQLQYYPALPLPVFEVPSIFEKFDTDTLFFIFYYQQGTYQQFLAARELKKQSWRYHKKYLTWFQ